MIYQIVQYVVKFETPADQHDPEHAQSAPDAVSHAVAEVKQTDPETLPRIARHLDAAAATFSWAGEYIYTPPATHRTTLVEDDGSTGSCRRRSTNSIHRNVGAEADPLRSSHDG